MIKLFFVLWKFDLDLGHLLYFDRVTGYGEMSFVSIFVIIILCYFILKVLP